MKTFALALLSASAEALMSQDVVTAVTGALYTNGNENGTFRFGYDSTAFYFEADLTVKAVAKDGAVTTGTEVFDLYVFPLYGTSLNAVVGCTIAGGANDTTWGGSMNLWVNGAFTTPAGDISAINTGTVQAATSTLAAGRSQASEYPIPAEVTASASPTWTLLSTGTMNFTATNRVISCKPRVKMNGTLAQNKDAFTSVFGDMMNKSSATARVYLGYNGTGATQTNAVMNITSSPTALSTAIGQVTTGTVSTGTVATSGGKISGTPGLAVTAWTSSTTLYVDFDSAITSTVQLANGNKYATMQCIKLGTSEYMCVCSEIVGQNIGNMGKYTWTAWGSATAPAAADFTANLLPTDSTTGTPAANLATATKYYPLFNADSVDTVTNSQMGTIGTAGSSWYTDTAFQWSATGNYVGGASAEAKQFFSRLQYKRTAASETAATALKGELDGWVASTVGGCGDYDGTDTKAVYTWTADTTSSTSTTCTTTTTGALSLATIGAAIALAVAF